MIMVICELAFIFYHYKDMGLFISSIINNLSLFGKRLRHIKFACSMLVLCKLGLLSLLELCKLHQTNIACGKFIPFIFMFHPLSHKSVSGEHKHPLFIYLR